MFLGILWFWMLLKVFFVCVIEYEIIMMINFIFVLLRVDLCFFC